MVLKFAVNGRKSAAFLVFTRDQAKNNVGSSGKLKGPVHQALAARRSREFNRADTDFLPTLMLEEDTEN